jgi:hypothetical protein
MDISIDKSPRQIFSYFRRSTEGAMVTLDIKREQLGLCYICKKPLDSSYDIDHFVPLVLLHKDEKCLSVDQSNLYICCSDCNRKKSSKIRGIFSIESDLDDSSWLFWGEDIYKSYKNILKQASKGNCPITSLQLYWNKYISKDYKSVIKDKYPLDIRVIDIVEEHLIKDLEQYFKDHYEIKSRNQEFRR